MLASLPKATNRYVQFRALKTEDKLLLLAGFLNSSLEISFPVAVRAVT